MIEKTETITIFPKKDSVENLLYIIMAIGFLLFGIYNIIALRSIGGLLAGIVVASYPAYEIAAKKAEWNSLSFDSETFTRTTLRQISTIKWNQVRSIRLLPETIGLRGKKAILTRMAITYIEESGKENKMSFSYRKFLGSPPVGWGYAFVEYCEAYDIEMTEVQKRLLIALTDPTVAPETVLEAKEEQLEQERNFIDDWDNEYNEETFFSNEELFTTQEDPPQILSILTTVEDDDDEALYLMGLLYDTISAQQIPAGWQAEWLIGVPKNQSSISLNLNTSDWVTLIPIPPNSSRAASLNLLLEYAEGNAIKIIDLADDLPQGSIYADLETLFDNFGYTASITALRDENGRLVVPDSLPLGNGILEPNSTGEIVEKEWQTQKPFPLPSLCFQREAIESVGGWEEVPEYETFALWLKIQTGWQGVFRPEIGQIKDPERDEDEGIEFEPLHIFL